MESQLEQQAVGVENESAPTPRLTLHHLGVLVKSMEAALPVYRQLGGKHGEPIEISSQGVRVCFVAMPGSITVELVEPGENSVTRGLLKRGVTYYHLGYTVANFDVAAADLENLGYLLLETFQSEAFDGKRCAFLMSPVKHLIEIIEQG